jgi:hypothetical protein
MSWVQGRTRVLLLIAGALLMALGCLAPVLVPAAWLPEDWHESLALSVVECALEKTADLQVHDTYLIISAGPGAWAARLVLAAGVALVVFAATRWRRAVLMSCGVLILAVGWLFLEVGRPALRVLAPGPSVEGSGWASYPPLSAVEVRDPLQVYVNCWWTRAALGVGAALVAGSGLLRPGAARAPAEVHEHGG